MPTKIAITGAAGFIGSSTIHTFKEDYDIISIDDLSHGSKENIPKSVWDDFYQADLSELSPKDISILFKDVKCVFHFAAISSLPECQRNPGKAYKSNVVATANVLEGARLANVQRVIFASTGALYENMPVEKHKECEFIIRPTLVYPNTKLSAENLCDLYIESYDMDIVTLRYHNVYGYRQNMSRQSPPFTAYVIRELLANKRPILHSNGEQKRDYVYIDDVVDANYRAMVSHEARGMKFNICSGKTISVNELYKLIQQELGSNIKPIFHDSRDFWKRYKELYECDYPLNDSILDLEVNKHTCGDVVRSKHVLKWVTRTKIEFGIRQMIEFIKNDK